MSAAAPVCVVGMHRSGTSLTMRMLAALGADLGHAQTQIPADPADNPEGYQEHVPIIELDDELLRLLGGHASEPPRASAGWQEAENLAPAYDRAQGLLVDLFDGEPIAFKDPRASLLLPFWRRAVPDLRIVVCVRDPLEVAESMARRGAAYPREHWIESWLAHTSAALRDSAGADRAIVLFDELVSAPRKVADDLALFLTGEPAELSRRESAAAVVDLSRPRSSPDASHTVAPEAARYYATVQELARASSRSRIAASVR